MKGAFSIKSKKTPYQVSRVAPWWAQQTQIGSICTLRQPAQTADAEPKPAVLCSVSVVVLAAETQGA